MQNKEHASKPFGKRVRDSTNFDLEIILYTRQPTRSEEEPFGERLLGSKPSLGRGQSTRTQAHTVLRDVWFSDFNLPHSEHFLADFAQVSHTTHESCSRRVYILSCKKN